MDNFYGNSSTPLKAAQNDGKAVSESTLRIAFLSVQKEEVFFTLYTFYNSKVFFKTVNFVASKWVYEIATIENGICLFKKEPLSVNGLLEREKYKDMHSSGFITPNGDNEDISIYENECTDERLKFPGKKDSNTGNNDEKDEFDVECNVYSKKSCNVDKENVASQNQKMQNMSRSMENFFTEKSQIGNNDFSCGYQFSLLVSHNSNIQSSIEIFLPMVDEIKSFKAYNNMVFLFCTNGTFKIEFVFRLNMVQKYFIERVNDHSSSFGDFYNNILFCASNKSDSLLYNVAFESKEVLIEDLIKFQDKKHVSNENIDKNSVNDCSQIDFIEDDKTLLVNDENLVKNEYFLEKLDQMELQAKNSFKETEELKKEDDFYKKNIPDDDICLDDYKDIFPIINYNISPEKPQQIVNKDERKKAYATKEEKNVYCSIFSDLYESKEQILCANLHKKDDVEKLNQPENKITTCQNNQKSQKNSLFDFIYETNKSILSDEKVDISSDINIKNENDFKKGNSVDINNTLNIKTKTLYNSDKDLKQQNAYIPVEKSLIKDINIVNKDEEKNIFENTLYQDDKKDIINSTECLQKSIDLNENNDKSANNLFAEIYTTKNNIQNDNNVENRVSMQTDLENNAILDPDMTINQTEDSKSMYSNQDNAKSVDFYDQIIDKAVKNESFHVCTEKNNKKQQKNIQDQKKDKNNLLETKETKKKFKINVLDNNNSSSNTILSELIPNCENLLPPCEKYSDLILPQETFQIIEKYSDDSSYFEDYKPLPKLKSLSDIQDDDLFYKKSTDCLQSGSTEDFDNTKEIKNISDSSFDNGINEYIDNVKNIDSFSNQPYKLFDSSNEEIISESNGKNNSLDQNTSYLVKEKSRDNLINDIEEKNSYTDQSFNNIKNYDNKTHKIYENKSLGSYENIHLHKLKNEENSECVIKDLVDENKLESRTKNKTKNEKNEKTLKGIDETSINAQENQIKKLENMFYQTDMSNDQFSKSKSPLSYFNNKKVNIGQSKSDNSNIKSFHSTNFNNFLVQNHKQRNYYTIDDKKKLKENVIDFLDIYTTKEASIPEIAEKNIPEILPVFENIYTTTDTSIIDTKCSKNTTKIISKKVIKNYSVDCLIKKDNIVVGVNRKRLFEFSDTFKIHLSGVVKIRGFNYLYKCGEIFCLSNVRKTIFGVVNDNKFVDIEIGKYLHEKNSLDMIEESKFSLFNTNNNDSEDFIDNNNHEDSNDNNKNDIAANDHHENTKLNDYENLRIDNGNNDNYKNKNNHESNFFNHKNNKKTIYDNKKDCKNNSIADLDHNDDTIFDNNRYHFHQKKTSECSKINLQLEYNFDKLDNTNVYRNCEDAENSANLSVKNTPDSKNNKNQISEICKLDLENKAYDSDSDIYDDLFDDTTIKTIVLDDQQKNNIENIKKNKLSNITISNNEKENQNDESPFDSCKTTDNNRKNFFSDNLQKTMADFSNNININNEKNNKNMYIDNKKIENNSICKEKK
ncbi:hypothetical protein EDEG_02864 [Edhazardia aedis USNM 41457]|uniref:Uncharacterized protein n=1 Tax=Edhazardia aedis (strain USNM 41457) TaxID=1003232 RepID=J8ZSV2_EDHAE|nr:hypothetical protein EDEG_02864 [Edhazardia aedis USNM 41457]|eukprot:EJW02743.1 hypothetical protein EDEG_02864 [Edhazardia aedis USNM 41457]